MIVEFFQLHAFGLVVNRARKVSVGVILVNGIANWDTDGFINCNPTVLDFFAGIDDHPHGFDHGFDHDTCGLMG